MNPIKLPSSQDKWIASGMWVVVLLLLAFSTLGIFSSFVAMLSYPSLYNITFMKPPVWLYISIALAAVGLVYFIMRAWGYFFTFTKQLFISLGNTIVESETGSVFYPFLTFKKEKGNNSHENDDLSADKATGSIISHIIWLVALSYLMTIIELAFFVISTLFVKS